jgi:multiple sugar transport system permease protein
LPLAARNAAFGYLLMAPSLLFFGGLIAYPLGQTLFISLQRMNTLTRNGRYIGLDNYISLLQSGDFWNAFGNTLIWTFGCLVLQVGLGVGFALVLNGRLVLRPVARALVLFPYLLSTVVAVLVWQWLFNDLYGYLNYVAQEYGLVDGPINWLGRSPNAMISVILVAGWKHFPFVTIATLARLQGIPKALYDAAKIDGASAWSRFWDITLPQLKPVLAMVLVLRAIWDFKEFDLIFMMTGGGPRSSTETLPLLVYKEVFPMLNIGVGAALAVIMLVIIVAFFWIYSGQYERAERARSR